MPVPTNRDPAETSAALNAWLVRAIPEATAVTVGDLVMPDSSGYSNETLVFDAEITDGAGTGVRGLVARIQPTGTVVFPDYDMALQYRCMEMAGTVGDVPVPPLVGYEADPSVLGQPFYVMEKVEGRVPADNPPYVAEGWLKDADPADQARLYESSLGAMAAVAAIDPTSADLEFLNRADYGPPGVSQQLAYYDMAYEWALGGRTSATADAARQWLHDNLPADPPANRFSWGDSRLGNIIYQGFETAAVLDWEMASLAPPEMDLAWFLMFLRYHTDGHGLDPLPGFPGREGTVAAYETLLGRPVRNLEFYEMFAWYRFGMILIRISDRMVEIGELPAELGFALNSPSMTAMATELGVDPP